MSLRTVVLGLAALLLACGPGLAKPRHAGPARVPPAPTTDETACGSAIAAASRAGAVPPRVLGTIAAVESGRTIGQRLVPWPWAINADGVGRFYASKAEAVAAVQALQAAGTRSIDVGCMQINLAAHPQAFGSLEDAFDPAANASYAASFLRVLMAQTGRLADAMTAYHSHTPEFAADYARRLLAVWPAAAGLGLGPVPTQDPPAAPPSALTASFRRQISSDHARLEAASQHGSAWPTGLGPSPPAPPARRRS